MSLFGKKEMKSLAALKGAEEITAEMIAAANAELTETGITAVELVSSGSMEELRQRNQTLEEQLRVSSELQGQLDAANGTISQMTEQHNSELEALNAEIENLKTQISNAGGTPPAGSEERKSGEGNDDPNDQINAHIREKYHLG